MIASFGAYAGQAVLVQDQWMFDDEATDLEEDLHESALEEFEPTYRALWLAGIIEDEDLPAEMVALTGEWIFGPARLAA